jgi:hypothetical protein
MVVRRATTGMGLVSASSTAASSDTTAILPGLPVSGTVPHANFNAPPQGNTTTNLGPTQSVPPLGSTNLSPSTATPPTGTDSGYISFVSTPDKESPGNALTRKLFNRKPTKLSIFDKSVPEPVRTRFLDLQVFFNEPLYNYLMKHRVTTSGISIKLKYAGESEEAARPWIVVQCHETASKRVTQFFKQRQIKAHYQPQNASSGVCFGLSVRGTPPTTMAAESCIDVYGSSSEGAATLCGKVIRITAFGETRIATFGGVIKVTTSEGVKFYGMTAGHIITQQRVIQDQATSYRSKTKGLSIVEEHHSGEESAKGCDYTKDHEPDERQESSDEEDANEDEGGDGDEEEFELDFGVENDQSNELQLDPTELYQNLWRSTQLIEPWPKVGHVSAASHWYPGDVDLDWALVELGNHELWQPNIVPFENGRGIAPLGQLKQPTTPHEAGEDRAIVLISGMAGLKRGKISMTFAFLMSGLAKRFIKTYSVTFSGDSKLDAGDCGSWVVDIQTLEVYGHVVASDAFGEAYVIPLEDVFQDIKHRLTAEAVCLPSLGESNWNEQYTIVQSTYDSAIDRLSSQRLSVPNFNVLDYDSRLSTASWASTVSEPPNHSLYSLGGGTLYPDHGRSSTLRDLPWSALELTASRSVKSGRYLTTSLNSSLHDEGGLDSGYCSRTTSNASSPDFSLQFGHRELSSNTLSPYCYSSLSPNAYLCLHASCDYQSKRLSDLERHMMKHFPTPSEETSDCPERGHSRVNEFGFSMRDQLNPQLGKAYCNTTSKEVGEVTSIKRSLSATEESKPRGLRPFTREDIAKINAKRSLSATEESKPLKRRPFTRGDIAKLNAGGVQSLEYTEEGSL